MILKSGEFCSILLMGWFTAAVVCYKSLVQPPAPKAVGYFCRLSIEYRSFFTVQLDSERNSNTFEVGKLAVASLDALVWIR